MDDPVIVGQRIKRVRRLNVKEQGELDLEPQRQGPVCIELDTGLVIAAVDGSLVGLDRSDYFPLNPTNVEVEG